MSKLSFRARALDPSKQMPIYLAEELPDLPEYSAINRAVPQMPSGMEKEEESEHHLQRAICTGLIIPTPEVFTTDQEFYDRCYPPNYKMPRQMIHMQPLGLEQDVPDYDMDSGDEAWINQQSRRLELTPLKFEQMMDRLEKSSGQMVVKLNEAKALLKQDDEVSIAVYDYWLNKRLKMQHPLILTVKTENRPGASSNNPYLAFRRRTEKMQTRKNRKNDETSYEKMLKLRRDLQRATTMLEMVKRREKTKREQLHLSIQIFEKRVQLRDFSGALLSEYTSSVKNSRPAFAPLYTNQYSHHSSSACSTPTGGVPGSAVAGVGGVLGPGMLAASTNSTTPGSGHLYSSASQYLNSSSLAIDAINAGGSGTRKEKRQYKKRKHKLPRDKQQQQQHLQQQQQYLAGVGGSGGMPASAVSGANASALSTHHLLQLHRQSSSPAANESNIETEEEEFGSGIGGGGQHAHKMGSESEEEAPFAFRRKQSCDYLRPLAHDGNWPWESKEDNGFGDTKYRFTLTSIRHPRPRCIGFARRRVGRGGRVILDRVATNMDDFWSQLDYTIFESGPSSAQAKASIKKELAKPASPPTVVDLPSSVVGAASSLSSSAAAVAASRTTTVQPQQNKPATIIKVEPADDVPPLPKDVANSISDDDGGDFDDEEGEVANAAYNDVNVSRDPNYISAVTLVRRRQREFLRLRARNRRQRSIEGFDKKRRYNHTDMDVTKASAKQPNPDSGLWRNSVRLRWAILELRKLFNEEGKREKLNGDDVSEEVVVDLVRQKQNQTQQQQQRPNHRSNNNLLNNNNNNSSSNINKNVGVSDKFHVIKSDAAVAATVTVALSSEDAVTKDAISEAAKSIKQEMIDCTSGGASADDSNEPLSSIKKSAASAAINLPVMEDEEDVNLAQLSSLIRHTVKKEPLDATAQLVDTSRAVSALNRSVATTLPYAADLDDDMSTPLNQMPDVIRLHHRVQQCKQQVCKREAASTPADSCGGINVNVDDVVVDDEYDYMGNLSPSSSQRLDFCSELLSEIRRDWLHFRPKTPSDELPDSAACKLPDPLSGQPLVDWSQQTPIALEMLRIPDDDSTTAANESVRKMRQKQEQACTKTLNSLWDAHSDDALFVSSSFKYADLEPDTQLLQSRYNPEVARSSSKSPDGGAVGNSNSGIDFNLSGDSLTDINLLGDGDETENMLVNILKECDNIKTLNQATNFWNGILEGEAEVDEVGADVESAADLLDCIDEKVRAKDGKRTLRARGGCGGKIRNGCSVVGSTSFSASNISVLPDEAFFKKDQPKSEPVVSEANETAPAGTVPPEPAAVVVKTEPADELATGVAARRRPQPQPQPAINSAPNVIAPTIATIPAHLLQSVGGSNVTQFANGGVQPQLIATAVAQRQLQHQQQQQQQSPMTEVAAVGDIITVAPNSPSLQQQQQQHQLQQVQVQPQQQQQQQQILQLRQPRLQNVMQQLQQIQQQQRHQQLLQMQREIISTPLITQYVPATTAATGSATGATTVSTTALRQPTLTPIGSSATGNHTIYTTTVADGSVVGSQKIYIQKTPATVASSVTTQVPSSLSSNAVITLSNVKLESGSDGNQPTTTGAATTNILTIDGNAVAASVANTPNVNIISTAGGQQLAVHSIGGVQHVGAVSSTATTPLIVTAATARQAQQLAQQQQLVHAQPTQQIVWRQIGTTTNASGGGGGGTTTTGVLSTTTEAAAAMSAAGNKIVWASRPGQKRQLNGPDGATDINKLLLNRKFSQRKIITQHPQQQHQIQITKHLQQLQQQQHHQQQQQQQQQQDDESSNGSGANSGFHDSNTTTATTTVAATTPVTPHLQKVQMQGGKVIKMASYPLLVSELNVVQQQQQQQQQQQHQQMQQQKLNSAAIAANHNYSLQPTAAIITSQSGGQSGGGNKIFLTSSSAGSVTGGTTNFTIATASDLAAAVGQQASGGMNAAQKLHHYKELQNSSLKVNFVSTSSGGGGGGGVPQGNIVLDAKTVSVAQQQHQQQQSQHLHQHQQTVVLNKAAAAASSLQQQQQKLKRERILNIIGAPSVEVSASNASNALVDNSKRVLYTSLLNVKPLQKNNAGQMQMQIGAGGVTHALLRGRIGNNQTIFTNMRTVPLTPSVANAVQQLQVASSGGGGVNVSVAQVTTNATAAQQQSGGAVATTGEQTVTATTPASTATAVTSNDIKGIDMSGSNNNNGNAAAMAASLVASGGNSNSNSSSNSGGGGTSNSNSNSSNSNANTAAVTTNTNNTIASTTINR